jgi:hypothetical protein
MIEINKKYDLFLWKFLEVIYKSKNSKSNNYIFTLDDAINFIYESLR